jgi:nucleotide-binding universal stress UspA family protein
MYKRLLIVVDQRPVSDAAVKEGVALAKAHGAEIVFFSVLPRYTVPVADMPPFPMLSPGQFLQVAKANAHKRLAEAKAAAEKAGVASRTATGSGEDDSTCIAEAAGRRRCDIIVVATAGRNALLRLLTGSVVPGLITASTVPVLVCKDVQRVRARTKATVVRLKPRRAAPRAAAAK